MFSPEELRGVPIFADLGEAELDYLARTSADMRLQPGEYVLHEGDTHRALFVLIEGRIEVTKTVADEERVIGVRGPGETFGELPVVLDSPFLVSMRAVEASRVMRIETKDFHVVAASAPEFAAAVEASAIDRFGGLQEFAATTLPPRLTVVGPHWDDGTHDLRDFLQRNSVEFDWIEPATTTPPQPTPIVRLRDGSELVQPSHRQVGAAMGLRVAPSGAAYDVAIVGGGPAGLAAAVYGASEGLSTILLECEAPGGQAGTSSRIENYLGFPYGISGDELAHRALQQARRLGAEIVVTRKAESLDVETRTLCLDGGETVRGEVIVLATGVAWRSLPLPALERLRGRGVYYGAAPGEARSVAGKALYLVGGGNSAGQAAMNAADYAASVTLLVRGTSLAASMSFYLIEQLKTKPNIRVETCAEVVDAHGEEHLEALDILDRTTGKTSRRDAAGLFILIGADAETAWLPPALRRDEQGYVLTGRAGSAKGGWPLERPPYLLETTVPGIFCVGDVRAASVKRVAAAVGEGSMAIAFAHLYLAEVAARRHAASGAR
ncbi:MAG TPA: FAD-dependent oxidoreductase [Candidatus Elarobacter sp.]